MLGSADEVAQALSSTALAGRPVRAVEVPTLADDVAFALPCRGDEVLEAWREARGCLAETGRWPVVVALWSNSVEDELLRFGFHPYADFDEVDTSVSRIIHAAAGRRAEEVISRLKASEDALPYEDFLEWELEQTVRNVGAAPSEAQVRSALGPPVTRAAAIAAAACAASFTAGLLAEVSGDPCQGDLTPIFFSGTDNPETTRNIKAAQDNDGRSAHLTRWAGRPRTKPPWYNSTSTCNDAARATCADDHPKSPKAVCDEYPFHSTHENQQTVATVTLRLVPEAEGTVQFRRLGDFVNSCKVGTGGNTNDYVVVPVSVDFFLPSFGFCPTR